MLIRNFFGHLTTVMKHKYYVFKNCLKAGMPIRGILHDMSKFSPTEFFEGVKYYNGNSHSPVMDCIKENGYSEAWFHHRGHNRHHFEYWQNTSNRKVSAVQMPFKDALELVCDYVGAGETYNGRAFTYTGEYAWWQNRLKSKPFMHRQTLLFTDMMLKRMAEENSNDCLRQKISKEIYAEAERQYKEEENAGLLVKKRRKREKSAHAHGTDGRKVRG